MKKLSENQARFYPVKGRQRFSLSHPLSFSFPTARSVAKVLACNIARFCPVQEGLVFLLSHPLSFSFPTVRSVAKFLANNLARLCPVQGMDLGSISNFGGTTLRGHFFLTKKEAFSKTKRALLCLLRNLGGTCPQCPPVPTSMAGRPDFLAESSAKFQFCHCKVRS